MRRLMVPFLSLFILLFQTLSFFTPGTDMITFWQFFLQDDTLHMNTRITPSYNHDFWSLAIL